jgi:hypothetical protein
MYEYPPAALPGRAVRARTSVRRACSAAVGIGGPLCVRRTPAATGPWRHTPCRPRLRTSFGTAGELVNHFRSRKRLILCGSGHCGAGGRRAFLSVLSWIALLLCGCAAAARTARATPDPTGRRRAAQHCIPPDRRSRLGGPRMLRKHVPCDPPPRPPGRQWNAIHPGLCGDAARLPDPGRRPHWQAPRENRDGSREMPGKRKAIHRRLRQGARTWALRCPRPTRTTP